MAKGYAVLPVTAWRDYRPPADPPAPLPGTWGDHPPLPSTLTQAMAARWPEAMRRGRPQMAMRGRQGRSAIGSRHTLRRPYR
jgi:hypothetical protein